MVPCSYSQVHFMVNVNKKLNNQTREHKITKYIHKHHRLAGFNL